MKNRGGYWFGHIIATGKIDASVNMVSFNKGFIQVFLNFYLVLKKYIKIEIENFSPSLILYFRQFLGVLWIDNLCPFML